MPQPEEQIPDDPGFPQFESSPMTYEGTFERLAAFSGNASRLHGPRRWMAVTIALALTVPLVLVAVEVGRTVLGI